MKVLTVAMLVDRLKKLPPDTEVSTLTHRGEEVLDIDNGSGPLFVYEKDGIIRLYIDDYEDHHPDIEAHRSCLFRDSEVWKRIEAIRSAP